MRACHLPASSPSVRNVKDLCRNGCANQASWTVLFIWFCLRMHSGCSLRFRSGPCLDLLTSSCRCVSVKSWWQAIWRRKLQNPRASSIGLFSQSDEERRCRKLLLLGLSRSSGKDLQGLATPALCNTISYPGSRAWRKAEGQLESEEAAELVKEELLFVWGSSCGGLFVILTALAPMLAWPKPLTDFSPSAPGIEPNLLEEGAAKPYVSCTHRQCLDVLGRHHLEGAMPLHSTHVFARPTAATLGQKASLRKSQLSPPRLRSHWPYRQNDAGISDVSPSASC